MVTQTDAATKALVAANVCIGTDICVACVEAAGGITVIPGGKGPGSRARSKGQWGCGWARPFLFWGRCKLDCCVGYHLLAMTAGEH